MARVLIVGCDGQDGSYLTELLADQGCEVTGIPGPQGRDETSSLRRRYIDIRKPHEVLQVLAEVKPDLIYHLAAFHHSSEERFQGDQLVLRSFQINTLSLHNFLDGASRVCPDARLFYAASSHVFGDPPVPVQDESTPMNPICPYGISKTAGIHLCRYYREELGLHCSAGILYNHDSPRRSSRFLSKRIAQTAVRIRGGTQEKLRLGDLGALIDWGYAPDYVRAMRLIVQLPCGAEFIVASGELHSVGEFVELAFHLVGLSPWEHVIEDPTLLVKQRRSTPLCGNAARLTAATGWRPKLPFRRIVECMVEEELENAQIRSMAYSHTNL